jgi:hypothetical protein
MYLTESTVCCWRCDLAEHGVQMAGDALQVLQHRISFPPGGNEWSWAEPLSHSFQNPFVAGNWEAACSCSVPTYHTVWGDTHTVCCLQHGFADGELDTLALCDCCLLGGLSALTSRCWQFSWMSWEGC